MLAVWLLAAPAWATDALSDAVRTWLARDGVRQPADTLRAMAAPACPERALACMVGGPVDANAVRATCEAGDALGCLAEAWLLLPASSAGRDPAAPSDPARFRALVEGACAAGLPDGCVEVGNSFGYGVGTYRSEQRATGVLRPLCARGYGRACTALGSINREPNLVRMGADAGDPAALAQSTDRTRQEQACSAGHTAACIALAHSLADRTAARLGYDQACALGDPLGCVARIRSDAVEGVLTTAQAAAELDPYCSVERTACEEATFYRQGARPVVQYLGELTAAAVDRKMIATQDHLYRCYLEELRRNPTAEGDLDVVLRVEEDGRIGGFFFPQPFSAQFADCVPRALVGFTLAQPWGRGAARVPTVLVARHAAEIGLRGLTPEDLDYADRVFDDLAAWKEPIDACFLEHDVAEPDVTLEVDFRLTRDGRLKRLNVRTTTETPEVDACVLSFLRGRDYTGSDLPANLIARMEFLTPVWTAAPEPAPTIEDRRRDLPPVVVNTLVVRMARTASPSGAADLGGAAAQNIAAAHDWMAKRISAATGGQVVVRTEIRDVDAALIGARVVEIEAGLYALDVDLDELSPALLAAIEPGVWDSVFVWAPAPRGPTPELGHTIDHTLVRGATLSFLAVGRGGVNLPFAALHEWWHQVVARADRLLGVDLISNHDRLVLEEGTLDPRTWTEAGDKTVEDWYEEALARQVEPEMWADLWHFGERLPPDPTNLAAAAQVFTDGVVDPLGLNDGWVDSGLFATTPRVDGDVETFWFGLRWAEPVTVQQLTAYVGRTDAPATPSFTRTLVEVLSAETPDRWQPVETSCLVSEATVQCRFPPVTVLALRIVPASVEAVIRELQVR